MTRRDLLKTLVGVVAVTPFLRRVACRHLPMLREVGGINNAYKVYEVFCWRCGAELQGKRWFRLAALRAWGEHRPDELFLAS